MTIAMGPLPTVLSVGGQFPVAAPRFLSYIRHLAPIWPKELT